MPVLSLGNLQLDKIIGGGIEEGKSTILVGEPGSGKTTLGLQFLTDPLAYSINCAYLCIDKKPERIMEQAMAINKTVEQQIAAGTLKFVEVSVQDWTPEQNVNDLLLTIQLQVDALFRNYNVKRLVVDSLLPQILNGFNKETKQYFVRESCILFTVTKPHHYQFYMILIFIRHYGWIQALSVINCYSIGNQI